MTALPSNLLSMSTVALSDLCVLENTWDPVWPEQGSCRTNHLRVLQTGDAPGKPIPSLNLCIWTLSDYGIRMIQLTERRYHGTMLVRRLSFAQAPADPHTICLINRPWSWLIPWWIWVARNGSKRSHQRGPHWWTKKEISWCLHICAPVGPIQECQQSADDVMKAMQLCTRMWQLETATGRALKQCSNAQTTTTLSVMERTWICQILQLQCGPRKLHHLYHLFDQRVTCPGLVKCQMRSNIETVVLPQSCAFATQLFDSTVRCRTLKRSLLVASAKLFEHKPTGHCRALQPSCGEWILVHASKQSRERGELIQHKTTDPQLLEAQLKQSGNCSDWESAPGTSSAWCTFSIKSNARFAGLLARAPNLALAFGFKA